MADLKISQLPAATPGSAGAIPVAPSPTGDTAQVAMTAAGAAMIEAADAAAQAALLSGLLGGAWTPKAANFTAAANGQYLVTANATVTDPTPSEGLTFMVEVRNGTAVVGGVSYSNSQLIIRSYYSGAWASAVYTPGVGLSAPVPLTDGATITVDLATGTDFSVTLGGNRTLAFTNLSAGRRGVIQVTQDATGGRTLAAPSGALTPGGAGILLTANGSALDFVNYWYDGTKMNIAAGYRNMA
jgi:hypothetical protein